MFGSLNRNFEDDHALYEEHTSYDGILHIYRDMIDDFRLRRCDLS